MNQVDPIRDIKEIKAMYEVLKRKSELTKVTILLCFIFNEKKKE